jgi:hypothetical protein
MLVVSSMLPFTMWGDWPILDRIIDMSVEQTTLTWNRCGPGSSVGP